MKDKLNTEPVVGAFMEIALAMSAAPVPRRYGSEADAILAANGLVKDEAGSHVTDAEDHPLRRS